MKLHAVGNVGGPIWHAAALALAGLAAPAFGQAAAEDAAAGPPAVEDPAGAVETSPVQSSPEGDHRSWLRRKFFDEEDGMLDFSGFMTKGGFVPMPVVITEPAVDGGFGIVAQFVTISKDDPKRMTRRIMGAVKTGNGSYAYGYFQRGYALDGRLIYKFGAGQGKVNLIAHPGFAPAGVRYTNKYDYGMLASAMWVLGDRRFSLGPVFDFRQLRSNIDFQGLPPEVAPDFGNKLNTGALGAGLHFDSRDNPISPTSGLNAYVEGKFNASAFGSDRIYQVYDAAAFVFQPLSSKWLLGFKTELNAARGDFPSYFAPWIDLRGVEAIRYQGSTVLSAEADLTRKLGRRWSILAFAGYGAAFAGKSRVFDDSGSIFSGGVGFRYLIARKLGIHVGVDVATGPAGRVFYLQFGHAWTFSMD
jgi:hypothetical protein